MYWRPLPSRAPSPSDEERLEAASMPPDGRQHQTRCAPAPRARPACAADVRRGLPVLAEPGEEAVARRRRLVDDAVAGVAVVADRARVDQHRHTRLDDGARQHLGRADPAVAQALLERARPALVADADAAQVDDGVRAAQRARVELAGVRIPEHLVGVRRCASDDPQHPVVGGPQRRRQRRADQPGGTRDRDDGRLVPSVTRLYSPRSASNAPSSSRRLMVVRKRPASAPSISRWS